MNYEEIYQQSYNDEIEKIAENGEDEGAGLGGVLAGIGAAGLGAGGVILGRKKLLQRAAAKKAAETAARRKKMAIGAGIGVGALGAGAAGRAAYHYRYPLKMGGKPGIGAMKSGLRSDINIAKNYARRAPEDISRAAKSGYGKTKGKASDVKGAAEGILKRRREQGRINRMYAAGGGEVT